MKFWDDIRHKFSLSMYARIKNSMPKMSDTEAEALNAGDSWWEAELFRGNPNWQQLLQLKLSELSPEEQSFLNNETQTLCGMLDDWKIVHTDKDLPPQVWAFLKEAGFFGMVIAKEYGGKGFSAAAHSAVVMKIATKSLTAAVTAMVPNSLGPGELLYHYGTAQQKQTYLPRLAKGLEIPCFALTGPEVGSDASSMPDKGIVCKGQYAGQEVLGIRLNFSKRYITLAPVATLIGLAFKLYDPDHLLGDKKDIGITVCLLPRSHPGVEVGDRHIPLDQAFMNGTVQGHNVFVPIDWVIGGQDQVGKGWHMLVECLSIGRSISLPAISCAYGALCYLTTGAYAALREQFTMPIGQFEGVQESLAKIAGFSVMLDACRRLTITANDQGLKPAVASAIAKYHMTEIGRKILNHAMDIHGGRGIMMGPNNYLGRAYQGMPICITVEGANILTRNLIIYGQGAMSCHPYIRKLIEAVSQEGSETKTNNFDNLLFGYVGYIIRNISRSLVYKCSFGLAAKAPHSHLSRLYQKLSTLSACYSVASDMALMSLGGNLKRKERLSARLGDVMSYMYMASAVLKAYYDLHEPEEEKASTQWAVEYCLYEGGEALNELIRNFPNPIVKWSMRILLQPFGNPYKLPSDSLEQKLAKQMLTNSPLRKRLSQLVYLKLDPNDAVGRVEMAFQALITAQPILDQLKAWVHEGKLKRSHSHAEQANQAFEHGWLDEAELQAVMHCEALRNQIIQVDAFAADKI
ncbi:MAG: acyl-CoA dehydrogenase [Gammaproteobacteria bacterium]|nr:acyl-CoA dehydrogenase [Gammaproteobacteria bacterium]